MSENKAVNLNELGKWVLFRGLACHMLEKYGLTGAELGVGIWEYTEALDMSFEEIRDLDLSLWGDAIAKDIEAMKKDLIKQH